MMSLFKLNIDAGGNGYKLMSFDFPRSTEIHGVFRVSVAKKSGTNEIRQFRLN